MHETTSENGAIREFGSELGMPQPTKFISINFENITIWSEYEPLGMQNLIPEDIIEELRRTPMRIKKHITAIILSPFDHPMGKINLASVCKEPGYIIIYSQPESRKYLKEHMQKAGTLRHETGHIIDEKIKSKSDVTMFSCGQEWAEAMRRDSKIKKTNKTFPIPTNWVLGKAEDYSKKYNMEWGLREDFADSVRFFTGNDAWNDMLRKNYPNRYKIIRDMFECQLKK